MSAKKAAESFEDSWTPGAGDVRDAAMEARLSRQDPVLGRFISKVLSVRPPLRLSCTGAYSHFDSLVRSILHQQLSRKAAATIYARFCDALGGRPTPDRVMSAPDSDLRAAGISGPKARYLKSLAAAAAVKKPDLAGLGRKADEEIISSLTAVPGIGVWTAQMFLMFRLGRIDVLPAGDLGIRRGLEIVAGHGKPVTPAQVLKAGERWRPFRSVASLYLWLATDFKK